VKFAATEMVWKTDTHVPEYMFGRLHPDGTISGGIKIPQLDSILAGFSPDTKVTGLTSVPASDRPTATQATIAHWAFDIMVTVGSLLILLALWYGWCWLAPPGPARSRGGSSGAPLSPESPACSPWSAAGSPRRWAASPGSSTRT
jgi:cytochrome d ubiquinol oxidase subunit I